MAYWPTRREVRLSDPAIREIEMFVSHLERLSSVIECAKLQSPTLEPSKLVKTISEKVDIVSPDLRTLFNVFENLLRVKEDLGSAERAVLQIKKGVPQELRDKIESNKAKIIEILQSYDRDNPISLSFKAQRLTYLHDKLFHEAEIVTDARPIFDDSGSKIIEFVVTHELVLTHYSNEDFIREHFSLDNADILMIRKACDRAILKAKTIKEALEEKCRVEVLRDDAGE